jgi:hypothetical protein
VTSGTQSPRNAGARQPTGSVAGAEDDDGASRPTAGGP